MVTEKERSSGQKTLGTRLIDTINWQTENGLTHTHTMQTANMQMNEAVSKKKRKKQKRSAAH